MHTKIRIKSKIESSFYTELVFDRMYMKNVIKIIGVTISVSVTPSQHSHLHPRESDDVYLISLKHFSQQLLSAIHFFFF